MLKKALLFITTILTAASVSTGYGASDALKGNVNVATFLDWFNATNKYVPIKGLIVLDIIPIIFLIVQAILFFKDNKKYKELFTVFALMANLIAVFILVKLAFPIAAQITSWTPDNLPDYWIKLKDDWMNNIGLSSLVSTVGWLCFVITYFVGNEINTKEIRRSRFLNFCKNALAFLLLFILGMGIGRLYEFFAFPIQYELSGATFIEMHRPVDLVMRKVGPILFTIIATLHVLLVILLLVEKSKHKAWLIIASLVFLMCDTFIALQYNGPINDLFLTFTPTTIPSNFAVIRDQWLSYHLYRNIFITLGAMAIMLSFFVRKNNTTQHRIS